MDKYPITARSLEKYFHINADQFERAYKDHLSGYRDWKEAAHTSDWLLFSENIGPRLSIDETSVSMGELYTILSNKAAHGRKGAIVAIIKGTKIEDVVDVLMKLSEEKRNAVEEVTMDFSERNVCYRKPMLP